MHAGDSLAGHSGNVAQIIHGWDYLNPTERINAACRVVSRLDAVRVLAMPCYTLRRHVRKCDGCSNDQPCHEGLTLLDSVNEAVR